MTGTRQSSCGTARGDRPRCSITCSSVRGPYPGLGDTLYLDNGVPSLLVMGVSMSWLGGTTCPGQATMPLPLVLHGAGLWPGPVTGLLGTASPGVDLGPEAGVHPPRKDLEPVDQRLG